MEQRFSTRVHSSNPFPLLSCFSPESGAKYSTCTSGHRKLLPRWELTLPSCTPNMVSCAACSLGARADSSYCPGLTLRWVTKGSLDLSRACCRLSVTYQNKSNDCSKRGPVCFTNGNIFRGKHSIKETGQDGLNARRKKGKATPWLMFVETGIVRRRLTIMRHPLLQMSGLRRATARDP